MHCELNIKQSLWEGDVFGRLTPPPEDFIEMEQDFLFVLKPHQSQDNYDPNMEVESSLLDLEFGSICAGEFDGFKSGPTLAQLNETRSRSPLINPEMKRLHQAAIQTVGGGSKDSCQAALLQARSHSVLEQQLRTQPSASICHEQFYPSRNNSTEQLSSTVNQYEPVQHTVRNAATSRLQLQVKTENSSPSPAPQEKKPFAESYRTQVISPQLISPHFGNNYGDSRAEYNENSTSPCATIASSHNQQESVSSEDIHGSEKVSSHGAKEDKETEQDDASEDEYFDSDDEVDEAEEYCPYEKGVKNPTRRKGRKSESEDMVPNPTKLLNIVRELDRLNKIISDLKPINELPQYSRGRSRKEKNKLASRACRLKKKQQHEANKVKLHGLEGEQENLTYIINDMKNEIVSWAKLPQKPTNPLNEKIRNMEKEALSQQIAGHTTDFVRKVLKEVAKGNQTGGLHLPKPT